MIVTHEVGKAISIATPGASHPVWTLDYASRPKPFIHQVHTPGGAELSLVEPHDHRWHRGLWFTIKYVNGDNFWEEHEPFGIQRVDGFPVVTHEANDQATVAVALSWVDPGGEVPLTEQRGMTVAVRDDAYVTDWTSTLTASRDVVLDRTPFTTWGGYGGLSFRGSRHWHVDEVRFPDDQIDHCPPGKRGSWVARSGPLDGPGQCVAGMAFIDHPDNPRAPSPWYGGGGATSNFINAAFLFAEPLGLAEGESLTFRYRVAFHDGRWDAVRVHQEQADFLGGRAGERAATLETGE